MQKLEKLLGIQGLADMLDVPVRTVYAWRSRGIGPRGIRVGGAVKYEPGEVRRWLDENADPSSAA